MRAYDPATSAWSMNYFLTDHLGSVDVVLDDAGTVLSQQRYLPFGGERTNIGNITQTDFGYTGQRELDPGMGGLMDYRARMYSPLLGRFIQPDTVIPSPANPQALNRYSYVMNNAVNFTDPSGHKPCWATSNYSCDLSGWTQDDADDAVSSYSTGDQAAVVNFFHNQGVPVSELGGGGEPSGCNTIAACTGFNGFGSSGPIHQSGSSDGSTYQYIPTTTDDNIYSYTPFTPSTYNQEPVGLYIQILNLMRGFINDVNLASPLMWRKTFTAAKAVNPIPLGDAIIGAVGQGLTDAFNPNLSFDQKANRMGTAFLESGITGVTSDLIGVGVAYLGGGPYGYAGAQVISSFAIDYWAWPAINHAYLGSEYGY